MHQPGMKEKKVLPAEVSGQQGREAAALRARHSKEQGEKCESKFPAWRNPALRDPRSWATRGVPSPEHNQVNASGKRKRNRAQGPSLRARAVPTLISFPSPQLPGFWGLLSPPLPLVLCAAGPCLWEQGAELMAAASSPGCLSPRAETRSTRGAPPAMLKRSRRRR